MKLRQLRKRKARTGRVLVRYQVTHEVTLDGLRPITSGDVYTIAGFTRLPGKREILFR